MKYESKFKLAPFSMRWWWNESRRKVVCKAFCMHRAWKGQTYFFSLFICILLRLVCNQILRLPPPYLIAPPLILLALVRMLWICNLYAKKPLYSHHCRYHCKVNFSQFLETFCQLNKYDFTRSALDDSSMIFFFVYRILCSRERIKYDWV